MSSQETIRAWKDEEYRAGLSDAQRAALPAHPAGLIELSDDDLDAVAGGLPRQGGTLFGGSCQIWTLGCCPEE